MRRAASITLGRGGPLPEVPIFLDHFQPHKLELYESSGTADFDGTPGDELPQRKHPEQDKPDPPEKQAD